MSFDPGLMACPACRGTLTLASGPAGGLLCAGCGGSYRMKDGVYDLLPWSGGTPGPEWETWRDRLEKLQEWRRQTWSGGEQTDARQMVADDLAAAFFTFARVPEAGAVLDIGCGLGDLRRYIPRRWYWGLDPLAVKPAVPLPSAKRQPVILRGVGEHVPLRDGAFRTVLLCETLDHTNDPARVLEEAWRVLEPNGVLAVMQSVRLDLPPPPLHVRLRAALGSLKNRLRGRESISDAETKTHPMTQNGLKSLVNTRFLVESGVTEGSVMFLRALKQDLAAPRVPKRDV